MVAGVVGTPERPVTSAVTETETAVYRAVTLEEHAVGGRGQNGSVFSPVSTTAEATPFPLSDPPEGSATDAGDRPTARDAAEHVVVDPESTPFPYLSPSSHTLELTPAGGALAGFERSVAAEPGTTVPLTGDLDLGARPRPRKYVERRLDPGDRVTAVGTVEEDGARLVLTDGDDGPPSIVTRLSASEKYSR